MAVGLTPHPGEGCVQWGIAAQLGLPGKQQPREESLAQKPGPSLLPSLLCCWSSKETLLPESLEQRPEDTHYGRHFPLLGGGQWPGETFPGFSGGQGGTHGSSALGERFGGLLFWITTPLWHIGFPVTTGLGDPGSSGPGKQYRSQGWFCGARGSRLGGSVLLGSQPSPLEAPHHSYTFPRADNDFNEQSTVKLII